MPWESSGAHCKQSRATLPHIQALNSEICKTVPAGEPRNSCVPPPCKSNACIFGRRLPAAPDHVLTGRHPAGRSPKLLSLNAAGFVAWSLRPFDVITSAHELADKLASHQVELRPFTYPLPSSIEMWMALLVDTLLYLSIGGWASVV